MKTSSHYLCGNRSVKSIVFLSGTESEMKYAWKRLENARGIRYSCTFHKYIAHENLGEFLILL